MRVHLRLRKERLVNLIVSMPPVPDEINHDIARPPLPVCCRHIEDMRNVFELVGVDVKDRCGESLPEIGGVRRRARLTWVSRKADLIVTHDMNRPPRVV